MARVLTARRATIAEPPAPPHDASVGVTASIREAALEVGAARREIGARRLIRGRGRGDGDRLARAAARALVVPHRELHGVRARRPVGMARVLAARRAAVAAAPAPARYTSVGVTASICEAALEVGAAQRGRASW